MVLNLWHQDPIRLNVFKLTRLRKRVYENDTPDDGTTMRVGCQCSHEHADPEHEPDQPPNITSPSASV